MDWIIVRGQQADAPVIARFQIEMAAESEGTILDEDTVFKGVCAGLSDPSKGSYFLAKTPDGDTAGSLFLTKEWSDWNNCFYWWIQSVYVAPDYRHKGAFTALYSEVKRQAKSEGSASLRLYVDKHNEKAMNCYRRQGMDECHYLMYEEILQA